MATVPASPATVKAFLPDSSVPATATAVVGSQLRLRMTHTHTRHGVLDGAWWPYSTDLAAELPALIAGLEGWLDSSDHGPNRHVSRVAVSLTIWTNVPRRIEVAGHRVNVAWFGSIDAHTISVSCPNVADLDLLVIPPTAPPEPALAAMLKAVDGRNSLRGTEILTQLVGPPTQPAPSQRPWTQPSTPQHDQAAHGSEPPSPQGSRPATSGIPHPASAERPQAGPGR